MQQIMKSEHSNPGPYGKGSILSTLCHFLQRKVDVVACTSNYTSLKVTVKWVQSFSRDEEKVLGMGGGEGCTKM
jgi:hypothetical protein